MADDHSPERRSAVALAYRDGDIAPKVVAKGYGTMAERIIEEARRCDIFVHDSPELVALLMGLKLDEAIPEELYMVIAELLVWLKQLDHQ